MLALAEDLPLDIKTLINSAGKGGAQLPNDELDLLETAPLISQTGGRYGKGEMITQMNITPDMWFFKCHFPGDPVMPGCLGIECLWQSLGLYLSLLGFKGKGRALGVGELKFNGEVLKTSKSVEFHLHIEKIVSNRKFSVALADGEVRVDGKVIYQAKQVKVGIFPRTEEEIKQLNEAGIEA